MLALFAVIALIADGAPSSLEPVAVAPWKNLNDDASLAWLEQGAAETMASDLKRAGVDVVERARIAAALARIAESAAAGAGDDVATAVAAGRIVGARSIVLGSFQHSAGKIRLSSRIVDVETGRVAEAAQSTGALADIFALQDDVVAALARRVGRPRSAPRAPARAANVPAYAAFSRSLTVPAAEQRALLEESLRLDPGLRYAQEALAALEARLRDARGSVGLAWDARQLQLLALVDDSAAPGERRLGAARALLADLEGARRFRALANAAERVLAARLPRDIIDDVDACASAARVLALARLGRADLALQAGEKHLAAFPSAARRADVEGVVRELVEERRSLGQRRADYDAELRELANEAEGEHRAWRPCLAAKWSRLGSEMVRGCTAFLTRFPASEHAAAGRAFAAWGHALTGDFAQARALADALEREVPGAVDDTGLRAVMARWSAD